MAALTKAIMRGRTTISPDGYPPEHKRDQIAIDFALVTCWRSSILMQVLAALNHADSVLKAYNVYSSNTADPNRNTKLLDVMRSTPSADLAVYLTRARKAAIDGKFGEMTVLGIHLQDVELIEQRVRKSKVIVFASFTHHFVLAIGREGFRVYQSWSSFGYSLGEYLEVNGTRLRDWKEGKEFSKDFRLLCEPQAQWSQEINDACKLCFGMDLLAVCRDGKPGEPIVPVDRPWVRMTEYRNLKATDIKKFTWS